MNRGAIRDLARVFLAEPTASYWSDAELNNYIQYGLDDFCSQTDTLEDISTSSLIQYQADYAFSTICSDYTKIKRVEIVKGNSIYVVEPEDLDEHYQGTVKSTSNPPAAGNIWGDYLRLRERPSAAATATTLNTTITSSDTSVILDSASGFPRTGRITIGSECIIYWGISTATLTPCERGAEGTTAAEHTAADAVTLRDIYVYHMKKNVAITSDSTTPDIPAQFHQGIAHYAAWLGRMKSKDYDLAREQKAFYDETVAKGMEWSKFRWKRVYASK